MQRRAIRDAKTPDKMKKATSLRQDNNLTLQEKKEKIQIGLKKLAELGMVKPESRYQDLINDIAKVNLDYYKPLLLLKLASGTFRL